MVNKVILVGNLGKDPVLKRFSETNAIAEFSLATSERYRDKEGNLQTITDWHNIRIPFARQAEVAEKYLRKGMRVYVEGKIRTREYEKDGQKRYITEVIADNFQMLDKKEDGNYGNNTPNQNVAASTSYESTNTAAAQDDDLPF
ncbi:MAG: single-stranded DNA-binding protein [Chitinophagales bacterium]